MIRPVRLTNDAAWFARWILNEHHGCITDELIDQEAPHFGANKRTVAILKDALDRAGETGVRQLSHWNEPAV